MTAITTPRHGFNRRIYVPLSKEATFGEGDAYDGTGLGSPDAYGFSFVFNCRRGEGSPIRPTPLVTTDMDLATGYEGASKQIHMGQDLNPNQIGMLATDEGIAWVAAFAMGNDTVSTPTAAKLHSITMQPLSSLYPGSFGLEEHLTGASTNTYDFNHKGVVIDEFTLSGGRTGLVNLDFTVSGSGATGTPATVGESNLTTPTRYFPAENVQFGLATAGTEGTPAVDGTTHVVPTTAATPANMGSFTTLNEALESWSVTYRNIWGLRRAGGVSSASGNFGIRPVWVRREVTWEITMVQSGNWSSLHNALLSGTSADNKEYSIGIEGVLDVDAATNEFVSFYLMSPLVMIEPTPTGSFSDLNTETITFSAKDPIDGQNKLYAYVVNAQAGTYNQ